MRLPGFVYVMVSPTRPGIVKVGKTTRPPEDCTRDLHSGGKVENFRVKDAAYFSNYDAAEGFVHDYLKNFQSDENPEYFEVPVEIAMKGLSLAMERLVGTRADIPKDPSLYDDESIETGGFSAIDIADQAEAYRKNRDFTNALKYYKRAARLGEPRSFAALAEMCEAGEGCTADTNKASEWLNEGARLGSRECSGALADRAAKTPQVAIKHLRTFFEALDVSALTEQQRQTVIRRLRFYLDNINKLVLPDDERIIPHVLEGLASDKEHPALTKQWKACIRQGRPGVSPMLRIGLALALLICASAFFLPAIKRYMARSASASVGEPISTPETADPATLPSSNPSAPGTIPKTKTGALAAAKNKPTIREIETPGATAAISRTEMPASASPSATGTAKTPAPETDAPAAKPQISAEELTAHFDTDKQKATAAFKNETIRMTDTVTKVSKHGVAFKKVKCKFDSDPPERIAEGATVTVEGTVHGKGFWTGNITLDHCRILP